MKASDFSVSFRYLNEGGKRNMTVTHLPTNIKITSPNYSHEEKTNDQLKSLVWEVMKKALEVFKS
jgi:hypothetical protein